MLINAHSTHQSLTFGQTLSNKDDSQDFIFALPFVQSASSDSVFAETLALGIQPTQPQNNIEIRENLGLLGRIQKAEQTPKILGFPVDEEGYLTATFNNAAGIPESFKIHSQTIMDINNYPSTIPYAGITKVSSDRRIQLSTSEDLVNYFQATYTRLQEIMGDNLQTETGFFSQEQLDSMPHAFVTRDGSFGGEIQGLYDKNQLKTTLMKERAFSYSSILGLEPKVHRLIPNDFDWKSSNWSSEKYLDENGNLSQGGLLAFAMWQGSIVANQQPDFYTQSFYDIKEGKMSIEEYIKQYAEGEFVEESYRSGYQESAKRQIAFASWLKEQGFQEEDLNKMKDEDFSSLVSNFHQLLNAHHHLQEKEEEVEKKYFDTEDLLLQLFATDQVLDPKLLDVPDSLFEEAERKKVLEDERYQPKKKEKETLTQKVRNAGAALAKVEQFLKTA